jgi:hypothetical protein
VVKIFAKIDFQGRGVSSSYFRNLAREPRELLVSELHELHERLNLSDFVRVACLQAVRGVGGSFLKISS